MKYLLIETWTKAGKKGYDVIAVNHNLGVIDIMDFEYTMDTKDLLEILGENDEKYNIGYLEDGFILIIYIKDLDKDKTFIIKKEFSVSFEKKGYDLFIPSV